MKEEQKQFIENIAKACIKNKEYGILPSLTIAQAICESNWGKCELSKYFNFFGMKWNTKCKCDYVELWTKEYINGGYVKVKAKFRAYKSFEDGIKGYYDFITGYKRYKNLIGCTDSRKACELIQKDGWATSPVYTETLYKIIRGYDLDTKYDNYTMPIENENPVENDKPIENVKPNGEIIYTVEMGDTLWGISKKYLGSGIHWRKIYDYNNMKNTLIFVGQKIKIPRKE